MTTRINITVDAKGLLNRNAQQQAAARQVYQQRIATEKAAAEGQRQLEQERIRKGLDPVTGEPLVTTGSFSSPGSSSRIRRIDQEPAAYRRGKIAVVAFDIKGENIDGQQVWRITTNDGTERIVELPSVPDNFQTAFEKVLEGFGEDPTYSLRTGTYTKSGAGKSIVNYHATVTSETLTEERSPSEGSGPAGRADDVKQTALRITEGTGFYSYGSSINYSGLVEPIVIPVETGKALAVVPCSYISVISEYTTTVTRFSATEQILVIGEQCGTGPPTDTINDNPRTESIDSQDTQSFLSSVGAPQIVALDFVKSFLITNNSIQEVQVNDLSVFEPFIESVTNEAFTFEPSLGSNFIGVLTFSQEFNTVWGSFREWACASEVFDNTILVASEDTGSPIDVITPAPAPTLWFASSTNPETKNINASKLVTNMGSVFDPTIANITAFGPGMFTLLRNPGIDIGSDIGPGIPSSQQIINTYFQDSTLPRKSIGVYETQGTAPFTWGTISGAFTGQIPADRKLTPISVKNSPTMRFYCWDWSKPSFCRQQLASLGISWTPV
jgi:hypothetical protein